MTELIEAILIMVRANLSKDWAALLYSLSSDARVSGIPLIPRIIIHPCVHWTPRCVITLTDQILVSHITDIVYRDPAILTMDLADPTNTEEMIEEFVKESVSMVEKFLLPSDEW